MYRPPGGPPSTEARKGTEEELSAVVGAMICLGVIIGVGAIIMIIILIMWVNLRAIIMMIIMSESQRNIQIIRAWKRHLYEWLQVRVSDNLVAEIGAIAIIVTYYSRWITSLLLRVGSNKFNVGISWAVLIVLEWKFIPFHVCFRRKRNGQSPFKKKRQTRVTFNDKPFL